MRRERVSRTGAGVVAIVVSAVVFLVPFAFIVATALKTRQESALLEFTWPENVTFFDNLAAVFEARDFMLVTAFAVILVTVLVQGMTLGPVIRWLRPPETGHVPARLTMSGAEASMARAQFVAVEKQAYAEDGSLVHPQLLEKYKKAK